MDYLKYVNIKQGSDSNYRFSSGSTLPLTQLPFGFASFAPQTDGDQGGWFYHPRSHSLEGVRLTHSPSPWIDEHGAITIMPQTVEPQLSTKSRWSGYVPENAVLTPHYLKLHFNRSDCDFELTPTQYGACIYLNYNNDSSKYLSILPVSGSYSYRFDEKNNQLFCETDCNIFHGSDANSIKAYFVFKFEIGDVCTEKTLTESSTGKNNGLTIEGENTAIHLKIAKSQITFSMATSFISCEQALRNLNFDSTYKSFETLKNSNKSIWNECLSRIDISATLKQMKTFYSCLYRTFLFPHRAYEPDENGKPFHYSPAQGKAVPGIRYTDNGFWDTYRTVFPLFSLIARKEYREMAEGFVNDYKDGGWLPRWTSGDAKDCMPSTAIDAVLADGAVKGILQADFMKTAFEGMEKHANISTSNSGYGRKGCDEYLKLGYVPLEISKESVNLTLDAAYFDFCLAQVAGILGNKEKQQKYLKRSKYYKNIFDPQTGFMRARDRDGNFRSDFNPYLWGTDYTEATAWQTTFAVQHDFYGLAKLFGGKENLIKKLDELFSAPKKYFVGGYHREIHEMNELANLQFGQCAISNQPSFHLPFIYAYFGERDKADRNIHRICEKAFSYRDDGFPGDEDNGSMSAWYIFASLGLYPIAPGKAEFTVTTPLVQDIKINGKALDIPRNISVISYEKLMESIYYMRF